MLLRLPKPILNLVCSTTIVIPGHSLPRIREFATRDKDALGSPENMTLIPPSHSAIAAQASRPARLRLATSTSTCSLPFLHPNPHRISKVSMNRIFCNPVSGVPPEDITPLSLFLLLAMSQQSFRNPFGGASASRRHYNAFLHQSDLSTFFLPATASIGPALPVCPDSSRDHNFPRASLRRRR